MGEQLKSMTPLPKLINQPDEAKGVQLGGHNFPPLTSFSPFRGNDYGVYGHLGVRMTLSKLPDKSNFPAKPINSKGVNKIYWLIQGWPNWKLKLILWVYFIIIKEEDQVEKKVINDQRLCHDRLEVRNWKRNQVSSLDLPWVIMIENTGCWTFLES